MGVLVPLLVRVPQNWEVSCQGVLLVKAIEPTSRSAKITGLLNHRQLSPMSGLLLRRTRTVHAIGMGFDVGLVFISKKNMILGTRVLKTGQILRGPSGTCHILETEKQKALDFEERRGLQLELRKI